jgi:hypothetical protein
MQRVFSPKITGSVNLHKITKERGIGLHLAGSIAGLIGNIGQGAYSAANAFMDSFCDYINSSGGSCKMMGFGALDTGMAVKSGDIAFGLGKQSMKLMDADTAAYISHFCGGANTYILSMDWAEYLKQGNLFEDPKFRWLANTEQPNDCELKTELALLTRDEQLLLLCSCLTEIYSTVLGLEAALIDSDRIIDTMGINSLSSVLIANLINRKIGTELYYGQVVGNFSIKELAVSILDALFAHD